MPSLRLSRLVSAQANLVANGALYHLQHQATFWFPAFSYRDSSLAVGGWIVLPHFASIVSPYRSNGGGDYNIVMRL